MIRIVAGLAGGRRLATPAGRVVRPTADRVREALFSSLAAVRPLSGLRILDLYAGTGAVGLEGLSRGAAEALLIESDSRALATLRANVDALALPGARVIGARVADVLSGPAPGPFDVLFADPPYALPAAELAEVLNLAAAGRWVTPDAVIVVERAAREGSWAWPAGFDPTHHRRYGEATLWYARHRPGHPGSG